MTAKIRAYFALVATSSWNSTSALISVWKAWKRHHCLPASAVAALRTWRASQAGTRSSHDGCAGEAPDPATAAAAAAAKLSMLTATPGFGLPPLVISGRKPYFMRPPAHGSAHGLLMNDRAGGASYRHGFPSGLRCVPRRAPPATRGWSARSAAGTAANGGRRRPRAARWTLCGRAWVARCHHDDLAAVEKQPGPCTQSARWTWSQTVAAPPGRHATDDLD
jgi:hypothetical protein